MVLPGRHLSENQVIELAWSQLSPKSAYRCAFKDGVWEILEVQSEAWGEAAQTTYADGHTEIRSTNSVRVVLRVRDSDGKVELVEDR